MCYLIGMAIPSDKGTISAEITRLQLNKANIRYYYRSRTNDELDYTHIKKILGNTLP